MTISYFNSALDNKAKELTSEKLNELMDSAEVCNKAKRIAMGETALKKQLSAATWQAHFPNGVRKAEEAVPTGLYMLDIDHCDDPRGLYEQKVKGREQELGIKVVHITPSTKGLRLVAVRREGLKTIAENQTWLAEQLKTEFDSVCHDLTRLSFLVPRDYFLYLDMGLFSLPMPEAKTTEMWNVESGMAMQANAPSAKAETTPTTNSNDELVIPETNRSYRGLLLSDIVKELVRRMGPPMKDGKVLEGDRNTSSYNIARQLRNIVDFRQDVLTAVMPRMGLSEVELQQLCASALKADRTGQIPTTLRQVLSDLQKQAAADETEEEASAHDKGTLPICPPGIQEFVREAPEDFKTAVAMVLLPIWATLATRIRYVYENNEVHALNLMAMVVASQASGKSFARRLVDTLLSAMKQQDMEAYQAEDEWRELCRQHRNAKKLPKRPHLLVRYLPADTTVAALLDRLKQSLGLHLFSFCEEIDTINKGRGASWNEKSDIYRMGFDGADYGQSRAGENTVSGIARVLYNLVILGTWKAMHRYFRDPEDGLVSRICFVTLPDQFGADIPQWGKMTDKERARVDALVQKAMQDTVEVKKASVGEVLYDVKPEKIIDLPWLRETIRIWGRQQSDIAVKNDLRSRDILRRRAAVMGMRAGVLAYYLWDERNTNTVRKHCKEFALWVADQVLETQLSIFGKDLERSCRESSELKDGIPPCRSTHAFDELPETFSSEQLSNLLTKYKLSSPPRDFIKQWKRLGYIRKEGKQYIKQDRWKKN